MARFVFKNIILSRNGNQIRSDEGILCAFEDENGEEKMMFVSEHSTNVDNVNGQAESSSSKPQVNKAATSTISPSSSKGEKVDVWGDEDSKILLDNYAEYLAEVGPMKKFRNKKCMWDQISTDIFTKLNIQRTSEQCNNRYKTILKRRATANKINKTSGNSPTNEPFEDEIEKIKAIDDSVEPEVLLGVDKCLVKIKNSQKIEIPDNTTSETPKKKKKNTSLSYVLKELHEDKEKRKEIRHKEKLEMIKNLLSKD